MALFKSLLKVIKFNRKHFQFFSGTLQTMNFEKSDKRHKILQSKMQKNQWHEFENCLLNILHRISSFKLQLLNFGLPTSDFRLFLYK